MSVDRIAEQREAGATLLDWMLYRMDDLIGTYAQGEDAITVQVLADAVHACAEHEVPELVARFNGEA